MKRIGTLLGLALMVLLMSWAAKTPDELAIGADMPQADQKMMSVSGKLLSLSDLKKENGLVVIFSCNTCPFVIAWQDRYNELHELAEKNNIGFVLVNPNEAYRDGDDSFAAMKAHAEKNKYTAEYVVDQNHVVADAFGADRTPHVFLFNAENKLTYRGAIDDNHKDKNKVKKTYLKDALNAQGSGKEIAVTSSKSLGCSIKRN
jgi:peroxiredoxin